MRGIQADGIMYDIEASTPAGVLTLAVSRNGQLADRFKMDPLRLIERERVVEVLTRILGDGNYHWHLSALAAALGPVGESGRGASGRSLLFRTARDLAAETPAQPPWVAPGLLASGAITEISAKVKTGKTTFLLAMFAAILGEHPFVGRPTLRSPIVLLSEERPATLRVALARAGLLEAPDLHILPLADAAGIPWPAVVAEAIAFAARVGAGVLAVDTVARWAGLSGDDENSSGAAAVAMQPLEAAAASGLAVLSSRHDRKSGGEVGESGRGSSAFAGAADILLQLRRANTEGHPNRRQLLGVGRFDDVPDELTLELEGGEYIALGGSLAVDREEAITRLLDTMPGPDSAPWTEAEVLDRVPGMARSTWQRARDCMIADGRLMKEPGHGKTGKAFAYRLMERPAPRTPGQNVSHENAATGPRNGVPNYRSTPGQVDYPRPPGSDVPAPLVVTEDSPEIGVPSPPSLYGQMTSSGAAYRCLDCGEPVVDPDALCGSCFDAVVTVTRATSETVPA